MRTFEAIGIEENIIRGLADLQFAAPTKVQEEIVPAMLSRQADLVCLAQTGTGKTAAFGIPLVQLTDTRTAKVQGLVLCPTRELCAQVARDIAAYARYVPALKVLAVYGGASIEQQVRALRRGTHLIVATPGRLHDLIRRGEADIAAVRYVVLDEADEMLQMGFQDELNAILAQTPAEKQTLLFSATMPKEVAAIARNYMNDPVEVTVGARNSGAENVQHLYYTVRAEDRYAVLRRLIDVNSGIYAIIFCRTRQETREIADRLVQEGYAADALHAELSQSQRDQVMNRFRNRQLRLLVATDVAARGLDVNDLTHVINYNLPDDAANYTHRSGRTGRAGKRGLSLALVLSRELPRVREIERRLHRKFEQGRIPTAEEICRVKLLQYLQEVKGAELDMGQMAALLPGLLQELAELDREELISRFLAREFREVLGSYRNAPDLNRVEARPRQAGRKNRPEKGSGGQRFTKFSLNIGKKDGIFPQHLIGEINDIAVRTRIQIGRIEIMKNSALMEADSRYVPQVMDAFQRLRINGKAVSIRVVGDDGQGRPNVVRARDGESTMDGQGRPNVVRARDGESTTDERRPASLPPPWKGKGGFLRNRRKPQGKRPAGSSRRA